ncbi:hypothetical protein O181_084866 [Austropuccinia psidii MF-1]|uniref:Uncharacterized protein n=1 Tax=Austropuccinia psidii MF-1 TaxID=1389203 RepID=A0A9Q3FXB3_9BASI|nr:hypothetical protein [Austropuccinia psidii MF-1]
MANRSPESQLSINDQFEQLVAHEDSRNSSEFEGPLGNEANDLNTQITSPCEEGSIPNSSQKFKCCTREEAKINHQEIEEQQKEKRQKKLMNT